MPEIPQTVDSLLQKQIHLEFQSHISYLSMAAFFERGAFKGFAHWMKLQAQEEHEHAMKIYNYLLERGAAVVLKGLEAPKAQFKSPADVFKAALKQEQLVTTSINAIYEAALKAKDYATAEMLNWFVKEQVEEEASASEILDRVELAGDDVCALLRLDHEA